MTVIFRNCERERSNPRLFEELSFGTVFLRWIASSYLLAMTVKYVFVKVDSLAARVGSVYGYAERAVS